MDKKSEDIIEGLNRERAKERLELALFYRVYAKGILVGFVLGFAIAWLMGAAQ